MPTLVQPFPTRSTVSEEGGILRISIPPKSTWVLLFFAVWLIGWTLGGVATGQKLRNQFDLFTAVWMIGWAFGEFWVSYAILYALAGSEILLVHSDTLSRRTKIFGIGRTRTYLVRDIRDLRF